MVASTWMYLHVLNRTQEQRNRLFVLPTKISVFMVEFTCCDYVDSEGSEHDR